MSYPRKERRSRILPLVGPVAALYLVADAASTTGGLGTLGWATAIVAVTLAATPLWLRNLVEGEVTGARRVGILGTLLGIAVAGSMGRSAPSLVRDVSLAIAVSSAGALVLELGLRVPDVVSRRGRPLIATLGAVCAALGVAAALPPFEFFDDLVLASPRLALAPLGMFAGSSMAALLVRLLRRRLGSSPEALASNAWAIMGLIPALAVTASAVGMFARGRIDLEAAPGLMAIAAPILLFGHVSAIDTRRRPRAGRAVRRYVATAITAALVFGVVAFAANRLSSDPLTLGVGATLGWILSVGFWRQSQRTTHRLLAPYGGRLLDALDRIRPGLTHAASLAEIGASVLPPLRDASGDLEAAPILWTSDPDREVRLDAARNAVVRAADFPPSARKVFDETPGRVVVASEVHSVAVRQPERRALSELLEAHDALCLVPLRTGERVEGAILVPRGRRGSAISLEEIDGLRDLGEEVAAMVALVTARDRAQRRLGELAQQRDRLEERVELLEDSLERLRADAKALAAGRGASRRHTDPVVYSKAMHRLMGRIQEIGPTDLPVTLLAEGGTPIDRVAHAIHRASPHAMGPFVVADCASLCDDDRAVALFGDDTTPGWLRIADEGTVLLADIPALSLEAQRALAEALAARQARPTDGGPVYPIDVRVVATSRVPLSPLVEAGLFDGELARWLTRLQVRVPPLRDRREDLPSLILLALDRSRRVLGRPSIGIDQGAVEALLSHDWPGNLRELQHVIDRAVAQADGPQVLRRHLPPLPSAAASAADPFDGTYAQVEQRLLVRALQKAGGNKSEAARLLGLKRTTFLDKLRRHGIGTPQSTQPKSDASTGRA